MLSMEQPTQAQELGVCRGVFDASLATFTFNNSRVIIVLIWMIMQNAQFKSK